VRAIVPGHVGVRNVKWLASVVTSSEEAEGVWQRGISYKGFAPGVKAFDGVDVERVPSVQEQPVMSAITAPAADEAVGGKSVECRGFAWSGGGRGIVRVDVSADGGATWTTARLAAGSEQPLDRAWAWTFWHADVPLPPGAQRGEVLTIVAKATDASYNTQPERPGPIWNVRGINYNAWPRVDVRADP
jgi:sulfite oxidase